MALLALGWQNWMRALQKEIWTVTEPSRGFPRGMAIEGRRLTPEEWEKVQEILTVVRPVVYMHNACMGFGCGIAIFEPPPDPVYPGVPREHPTHLLTVTSKHLPREGGPRGFEAGWEAFSPFSHSEHNAQRMAEYDMGSPRPKDYYDY